MSPVISSRKKIRKIRKFNRVKPRNKEIKKPLINSNLSKMVRLEREYKSRVKREYSIFSKKFKEINKGDLENFVINEFLKHGIELSSKRSKKLNNITYNDFVKRLIKNYNKFLKRRRNRLSKLDIFKVKEAPIVKKISNKKYMEIVLETISELVKSIK